MDTSVTTPIGQSDDITKNQNNTAIKQRYFLGEGSAGFERLYLQHQLIGPKSQNFLKRIGLTSSMRVLEVGTGVGLMTSWLAERLTHGSLIATDISPIQIQFAQSQVSANNISWVKDDILIRNPKWQQQFDLVYARFLLGHVTNPYMALEHMKYYLKPGGMLAIEGTCNTHVNCHPQADCFDAVMKLAFACQKQFGYRSIGIELSDMFASLQLCQIQQDAVPCHLENPHEKSLMSMALTELSPTLLKYKLSDLGSLEKLSQELTTLCQSNASIRYFDTIQTVGTMPFNL